jgi:putative methionine-R-sulfoxide reductase with GAF domain
VDSVFKGGSHLNRWFGRKTVAVSEREVIQEGTEDEQRLRIKLDRSLDLVLGVFAPASNLLAEVLLSIPHTDQVITVRLRPDASVALPIRVRAGEGIIGQVFKSGRGFAGDIDPVSESVQGTGSSGDAAHLLRTRASLVVPLIQRGTTYGVLSIESPQPGTFTPASITLLTKSEEFAELLADVTRIKLQTLTESQIIRDVIDKLRQQVAFAIDPTDLESTYYQILQVSAQIISAPNISGGLILVRDDSLRLAPIIGGSAGTGEKRYWAVRAARLGAFNSEVEWELKDKSIAKRVIETRKSALVPDVTEDPDYRNSGTGFAQSSELIVPLLDGSESIGVIGLVSSQLGTFTMEDQTHLEMVAELAVYAIKRGEEVRTGRRAETQLHLGRELMGDLEALFPKDIAHIIDVQVEEVERRAYTKILTWARHYTESDHAAIVLAEITNGRPTYLTVHADLGEHIERVPPRWLAIEGVTGRAFSGGATAQNAEIKADEGSLSFVPYYTDAMSEVAAPMKRGDETIGVLDVESKRLHHYTTEYTQWVEYLADQTAFVLMAIELARKTQLELKLEQLSHDIEKINQDIRQMPDAKIRPARDAMLLRVLTEVCNITGSSVGRILIAINAYTPADSIDTERGLMYYMISTDPEEVSQTAARYFPINRGVSGQVFISRKSLVFNDLASRPEVYFSKNPSRDTRSGMFIPVYEGAKIVGVVNFEAERPDAYQPEFVTLGQRASGMISDLLVVARLRLRRLLSELLREFETSILRIDKPDLEDFMSKVLQNTARLSDIKEGWGRLTLLRPSTDPNLIVANRTFNMRYPYTPASFDAGAEDDRAVITFHAFREAIETKQPVLILDTQELQSAEQRQHMPWPDARSLICVPLLRPAEGNETDVRVTGILAVASLRRSEFSEADKEMLAPFAQTIVYGLQSIALLGARKELMDELMHDFTKALPSLQFSMREIRAPLQGARTATDMASAHQYIEEVNSKMDEFTSLVGLTTNMMNWFFDLANEDLAPSIDEFYTLDVIDLIQDLEVSVNALARIRRRFTIRWIPPKEQLHVAGTDKRRELIAAVLFKYLDNAIKYSDKDDITVSVKRHFFADGTPSAVFAVSNSGRHIDELDRPLIFQLRFRPPSTKANVMGSGIGLFQARLIAEYLGGTVGYSAKSKVKTPLPLPCR